MTWMVRGSGHGPIRLVSVNIAVTAPARRLVPAPRPGSRRCGSARVPGRRSGSPGRRTSGRSARPWCARRARRELIRPSAYAACSTSATWSRSASEARSWSAHRLFLFSGLGPWTETPPNRSSPLMTRVGGAGQWVADVADVGAAEDADGLVADFDALGHLDVQAAEAPETRRSPPSVPRRPPRAGPGRCRRTGRATGSSCADPPLAGAGDAAEDRDVPVGLVGGPGGVDRERCCWGGAVVPEPAAVVSTRSLVMGIRSSKVLAPISWSTRSSCSSRVSRPSAYAVLSTVATWSRSASEALRWPPAMGRR